MTMDPYSPRTQIIGGLALAAIVFAAYAVGQGVEDAIVPALLVGAFVTFVVLGRARSDSLDTMSGIGDERTQENYTRAVAVAGTVLAWVIPGWWLVTVAQGDPNNTLALLGMIFAVTWAGSAVYYSRRG
jgi:hypothetical protein